MDKMNKKLKISFWIYVAAILAASALFEVEKVSMQTLQKAVTANTRYILELTYVFITILCVPFTTKGFDHIMAKASKNDTNRILEKYYRYSVLRQLILFVSILLNISIYYILDSESALYCGLICAVTLIYCFPSKKTILEYTQTESVPKQQSEA